MRWPWDKDEEEAMSDDNLKFEDLKDSSWSIRVNENGNPATTEGAILAVLQDIRRELKQLNALFKDQPFVYYPKGDK